jgi:hypothetical protein
MVEFTKKELDELAGSILWRSKAKGVMQFICLSNLEVKARELNTSSIEYVNNKIIELQISKLSNVEYFKYIICKNTGNKNCLPKVEYK